MKTCLITGVAGFIGSHLAERLIRDGCYVIGVDCFTDYYPRDIKESNLKDLCRHEGFRLIETDLLETDLTRLFREAPNLDSVFHLAAQAGVRPSWGDNFAVYTRNNIMATQKLLEAAKEAQLHKFVYASSSSIYGDAETLPTVEDVIPRPNSPYGVTKLAGEHLCMLYWRNYGVPVVALRFFTVYGPRQRPDMAFNRFIRAILEDREITVYGDGEQTRDFTYVGDIVEGTIRAARAPVVGQAFNLGGGSRVSVNQTLRYLQSITGKQPKVRFLEAQHGDVLHTSASTERAGAAFGYSPQMTLVEGLKRETEWIETLDTIGKP